MTRREYAIPVNLNGEQLSVELNAAGVPTDPLQISVTGGQLVVVWPDDLSVEQIALADTVVSQHDWTQAKELARRRALIKEQAVSLASSLDDPNAIIARNGNRVTYQAVMTLWAKFNQLINHLNGNGPIPTPLPAPRTWKQVLNAGKTLAQIENDPDA